MSCDAICADRARRGPCRWNFSSTACRREHALPLGAVTDEDHLLAGLRGDVAGVLPNTTWSRAHLLVGVLVEHAQDLDRASSIAPGSRPAVVAGLGVGRRAAYAVMFVPSKYFSTRIKPTLKPFARVCASSSETSPVIWIFARSVVPKP